ncbi:MAG: right-handed parallel beta-helix repeat-containing protein [Thermofilaceae archaeon]
MSNEAWIPTFDGKGRHLGHLRDADAADLLLQASRGKGYTRVPVSFLVYRESDVYKAKSGETGRVEVEGEDAWTVFNTVFQKLTPGRAWRETVAVRGSLTLGKILQVPGNTVLDLRGAELRLPDTLAEYCEIIRIGGDNVEIVGGILDGRRSAHGKDCFGVNCYGFSNVTVRGTVFRDLLAGVYIAGKGILVDSCRFESDVHYGITNWAGGGEDVTVSNCSFRSKWAINVDMASARSSFRNLTVANCEGVGNLQAGTLGIALASTADYTITGVRIANCRFTDYGDECLHSEGTGTSNIQIVNSYFGRTARYASVAIGLAGDQEHSGVQLSNVIVEGAKTNGITVSVKDHAVLANVYVKNAGCHGVVLWGSGTHTLTGVHAIDVGQALNVTYYGFAVQAKARMIGCTCSYTGTIRPLVGARVYSAASGSELVACELWGDYSSLWIDGANDVRAAGGRYTGGWGGRILVASALRTRITGAEIARHPDYGGVSETGTSDYTVVEGCTFTGTGKAVVFAGANSVARRNLGFTTEASGTATIPAGSTYVDVSHGLEVTPKPERFRIIPLDNLGNRSFWVSDVTSTSFRINISSGDTVDHSFGWSYE